MKTTLRYLYRTIVITSIFTSTALLAGFFLWRSSYGESVRPAETGVVVASAPGYSDHHVRSSRPIERITWQWASIKTAAEGTDNFPMTWAADDRQYTMGGDGYGFEIQKSKKSMILSRVTGPYDTQRYADLWDSDGKSYGLLALGNRLYAWRGPGSGIKSFAETWLYIFDLNGQLIEKKHLFSQSDRICMPAFLQLGKDYEYAFDDWVYAYAIEPLPPQPFSVKRIWREADGVSSLLQAVVGSSLWDVGTGNIWLMRAPRDQLMDRKAYQFFAGLIDGVPAWTADIRRKRTVIPFAENGLVSCTYVPWSNTYLFATEHSKSFKSNLLMFQAKFPWGPWHILGRWNSWGEQQGIQPTLFYWNFATKWFDPNSGAVIVFTGLKENDRYNCMRVTFEGK